MEHEYLSKSDSYEDVRFKTLQAILESQFGIEVNDVGGMIQIKKDKKLVASVRINKN